MRSLMRALIALFSLVIMLSTSSQSYADETREHCSTTVYGRVQTAYILQDVGLLGTAKPVFQGGTTLSCGKMWYDLWNSSELSGRGPYGSRGYGDEFDFTVARSDTVKTFIGPIEYEAFASYYLLNDFKRGKDDMIELHLDMGRPIELGKVTFTPYVRLIEYVGFGVIKTATLVQPGARLHVPLASWVALDLRAAETFGLGGGYTDNYRLNASLAFKAGDVVIEPGIKFTSHTRGAAYVQISRTF